MASVIPERLALQSKFRFRCHKGLGCFTRCCKGVDIILTPYDIIRLKNRLGISSEKFLARYTVLQLLEKTGLPVVILKLLDDQFASCPFVREGGCIIYTDRPTICRYYPLGIASLSCTADTAGSDFYFMINDPNCLGFEQGSEWTIEPWRKDQGCDRYDEINADWSDLLVRMRSFPSKIRLTDQSKQMFFLASYNIDKFRQVVFQSSFLARYHLDYETVQKMREDELSLLAFGLKWLQWFFFKEGDLKPKIKV